MDYVPTDGLRPYTLVCASLFLSLAFTQLHAAPGSSDANSSATIVAKSYSKGVATSTNSPNGQGQTSIALDGTGNRVVVAYSDFKAIGRLQRSAVSVVTSADGGRTFSQPAPLPCTPEGMVGGNMYPQVLGHPSVRHAGGSNFVCAVVLARITNSGGIVQTIAIYRSTDNGQTWRGPVEVGTATNPHGGYNGNDAAERCESPSIDVSPSGRVAVAWTTVGPTHSEISVSYSDNVFSSKEPSWSKRSVVSASKEIETGASIRFIGDTPSLLLTWGCAGDRPEVCASLSKDGGQTWSSSTYVRPYLSAADPILGATATPQLPALAVDGTTGVAYVAYADNINHDGGDIYFQSTRDGRSFTPPIAINGRPGGDRAQWFPSLAVDPGTGRIHATYYDQGVADSGDLTQILHSYSDDGGHTWSAPSRISGSAFHAAYSTDLNSPNLGDYNGTEARGGKLFAALTENASDPTLALAESGIAPRLVVRGAPEQSIPVRVTKMDRSSEVAPGETVQLKVTLENWIANKIAGALSLRNVKVTLQSSSKHATVVSSACQLGDLNPTFSLTTWSILSFSVSKNASVGELLSFALVVESDEGQTVIPLTFEVGQLQTSQLLSESFAGTLMPKGWSSVHIRGRNERKWQLASNILGSGVYHANTEDGADADASRVEALVSPAIKIPNDTDRTTAEFDIAYNTEDDTRSRTRGFDGCYLVINDITGGQTVSVPAQAFASEFRSTWSGGSRDYYPRQIETPFGVVSAWSGLSKGAEHVQVTLKGMAGHTVQLRWDFVQDRSSTGVSSHSGTTEAGVLISHVQVFAGKYVGRIASLDSLSITPSGVKGGATVSGSVRLATAATEETDVLLTSDSSSASLPGSVTIPEGHQTGTFSIRTSAVSTTKAIKVTATLGGKAVSSTLVVSAEGVARSAISATDDSYSVQTNGTLRVPAPGVLANDLTAGAGGSLVAAIAAKPAHGSIDLAKDGSFTYRPAAGFAGHDNFTYIASDRSGSGTAHVSITVGTSKAEAGGTSGVDTLFIPTVKSKWIGARDLAVRLNMVILDPLMINGGKDGSGLVVLSDKAKGDTVVTLKSEIPSVLRVPETVSVADGSISGVFVVNSVEVAVPTNVLVAAHLGGDTTIASVLVVPIANRQAMDDSYSLNQDSRISVIASKGLLMNDDTTSSNTYASMHPEGKVDIYTVRKVSAPKHGIVILNRDGSFTYIPDRGFNGEDTFTYRMTDGARDSEPATVHMLVNPILQSATVSSSTIVPGMPCTAVVKLTGKALPGGLTAALKAVTVGEFTLPNTLTFQRGYDTAVFTFVPNSRNTDTSGQMDVELNGITKTLDTRISAVKLSDLVLHNPSVESGESCSATIVLTAQVPTDGCEAKVTTNRPDLVHIESKSIPFLRGYSYANFTFATEPVDHRTTVDIEATVNGKKQKAELVLMPSVKKPRCFGSSGFAGAVARGLVSFR